MMRKNSHIFIATPMYNGQANLSYIESLMKLSFYTMANGIPITFRFIGNESLIQRARNELAYDFLQTECTHLLFIDADIGFDFEDIFKMVEADKDIIGGVCPMKSLNWSLIKKAIHLGVDDDMLRYWSGNFNINLDYSPKEGMVIDTSVPLAVKNVGTGCMLIKRQVFEKMKDVIKPYKTYVKNVEDKTVYPFFNVAVDPDPKSNVLLSEDYFFCKTWKDMGGDVFIAPWVQLTHEGTYQFSGKLSNG